MIGCAPPMSVDVRPVALAAGPARSSSSSRTACTLPPAWVPPLRLERRLFLNRRFNAFFTHGEAQLFLARRDGRVVGRISAQFDHAFNAYHGNRWGMFGFLELEDDPEILPALLDAAGGWLRAPRLRPHGRADGLHDERRVRRADRGLRPRADDQAALAPAVLPGALRGGRAGEGDGPASCGSSRSPTARRSSRSSSSSPARSSRGTASRCARCRGARCARDMDRFAEVYNSAWSDNWGFSPYSKKDLDDYAQELQLVFDETGSWSPRRPRARPAAVAITVPDINQVLAKMNGRLLPLGWWHFLRKAQDHRPRAGRASSASSRSTSTRAWRRSCTSSTSTWPRPRRRSGARWAGSSRPTRAMNRGMEAMGGRIVKRYRVYERIPVAG